MLAQAEVDGKTNEITRFAPLLEPLDLAGAVVTADALHAQREHAQFLVTEKDAHYILAVKNNQPALYAQLKTCPGARSRPASTPGTRPRPRRVAHPEDRPPWPPGSPSPTPPGPSRSGAAAGR